MSDPTSHDVTENLTILVDDIKNPKYHGVFDAYKKTWRETYDPSKGFSWNSLARVKNFWRVSETHFSLRYTFMYFLILEG